MADVMPFVASRYGDCAGEQLGRLLTPPYDVIDKSMQDALYENDPKNIVRVDFGRDLPGDDDCENRYTRSEAIWKQWKKDGTLIEDQQKSYYIYEQEYAVPGSGEIARRRGFFAAVRLEDFSEGGIRAHENTFDGPKADRFRLMRATNCNLSAIFCLYEDPQRLIDILIDENLNGAKPLETVFDGVTHRLWIFNKPKALDAIATMMKDKTLFIADGHHRYETCLLFRDKMREALGRTDGRQPFDYTLMYLNNTHGEGMNILPTHRLLSKETCYGVDWPETLAELTEDFIVEPLSIDHDDTASEALRITRLLAESGRQGPSFVLLLPKGQARLIRLRPEVDLNDLIDEGLPLDVKALDVTILHSSLINRHVLGNPEIELDDQDVTYVKDSAVAIEKLNCCKYGCAFLMNPTRIEQVTRIARLGMRMPHKSTYFYPKLVTGLVMRDLNSPW